MRIGIYLGYAPYVKQMSLKQEGLGRYLAYLLKGFSETKNELVIACPNWVLPLVNELVEEEDIDVSKIEVLKPSSEPVLFRVYLKWVNRKNKKAPKKSRCRIKGAVVNILDKLMDVLLCTKNIMVLIGLVALAVILGIILLPLGIVSGIAYGIFKVLKVILVKIFHVQGLAINIKGIVSRLPLANRFWSYIRGKYTILIIQEKIRKYSMDEIIRKAKHMKNPPDIWYSPTAFWGEFNQMPGVRVVCVPDLVTIEFSTNFSKGTFYETTKKVSDAIEGGDYFITYCNYVKEDLLLGKYFKKSDDIVAIPHAQNDMLTFLDLAGYFKRVPFKEDVNRYFACNIVLPGVLSHSVGMHQYLLNYDNTNHFSFKDVDYIFYPSQVRGNKNILNLVKAFEHILRKRNVSVKLILTCDIDSDKNLKNYINEKRLQYDVLSFSRVTAQQLAALYMCAKLVVNPTLYEGGFPFTFGEGMSVGTPSVMSRIPQVLEVMQNCELEDYLFDPYDYIDIAEKIENGIRNREKLLGKEQILYNELRNRSWADVCSEYVQAFQYFIDRSKIKNEI